MDMTIFEMVEERKK